MVGKNITAYIEQIDANKVKIGTWAYDVGNCRAKCKACEGKSFLYKKGKDAFIQHSKTEKHKENMKIFSNKKMKQLNIQNVLEADSVLKKIIKKFEVDLNRQLDSHNVPFVFVDCLVDCLKSHLSEESQIVAGVKLARTKAVYIAKHGIAKTFHEETIRKLQECDGFSIGFDESEMNKVHECEIMVMVALKETGIE